MFLTSNNTRELSEALKRRCLYLHIDYPDLEREKEIVLTKVPDITENLAEQVARIVRSIRQLELKKAPSVSETLDWARTLVLLGIENVDAEQATATVNILLKYQSDIAKAVKEFASDGQSVEAGRSRASWLTTPARPPSVVDPDDGRADPLAAGRLHPGAARSGPAGQPHREPRRDGGGAAHPARRP